MEMNRGVAPQIYFEGRFLAANSPLYPSTDRGLRFGESLFETLLCVAGESVCWEAHLRRLRAGLRSLSLQLPDPLERGEGPAIVRELLQRNSLAQREARVRISCTGGELPLISEGRRATLLIDCAPISARHRLRRDGLHLRLAQEGPQRGAFAGLKWSGWLPSLSLSERAAEQEEFIFHDDGFLLEGASTNIFQLHPEGLSTPPADGRILPGVTRARIFEAAAALSLHCEERPLSLPTMKNDEQLPAFALSNSLLPFSPALSFEGRPLSSPPPWWSMICERLSTPRLDSEGPEGGRR
ncbi:MAG: aminotransferase class IV [Myxococcota bacterium]|nr:aminotransferase class IV [Myxococcota bacterium]